jgi:hypothetical protein
MKWVLILVAAVMALAPSAAMAQGDQAAIVAVVKKVFDGMRARDTAAMRAQFAPHARLLGVESKNGAPSVESLDPSIWLEGIAKGAGKPAYDERIFDPVVEVDANIAHLWAYYEFWLGPKLSHCGYDSFFLVKLGDAWKVAQVADSRRTDCKPRS